MAFVGDGKIPRSTCKDEEGKKCNYDLRMICMGDFFRLRNEPGDDAGGSAASIPNWRTQPHHFAFSIFVTVRCPFNRS
jgi:hypothetical protein